MYRAVVSAAVGFSVVRNKFALFLLTQLMHDKLAQRRHLRSAAGHQLVVPSELMWPSGVLCTRSETMELLTRLLHDTSHNNTTTTVDLDIL